MANYNTALQRHTKRSNATHQALAEGIDHHTLIVVFPEMAMAKDVSSLPNLNALKHAYKRVWVKMFGENLTSQLVADWLFVLFLNNIEKAEKALVTWIAQKTGVPVTDQLTADMVDKLNDLIDDVPKFQEEITAILNSTDVKLTWWQRGLLWVSKIVFGKK